MLRPRDAGLALGWMFVAWSAYVAVAWPAVAALPEPASTVVNEAVRCAVFVAPALVLASPKDLGLTGGSPRALAAGAAVAAAYGAVVAAVAVFALDRSPAPVPAKFWFTGFSASTLMEEIAFRGVVVRALVPWGPTAAILVSAAAFAAIHFPGWWWSGAQPSAAAWASDTVAIALLGVVLGVLYLRTRSVWATTLVHAAHNLVAAAFV